MPKKTSTAKKKTKATTKVNKPAAKKKGGSGRGGFHREINPDTGFVVGTDQDAIAQALLEGGESRAAIAEELESVIDTETRNGTPKQITNMISGVLNKMVDRGYIVESSFQVLPPTPASKRAATAAKKKAASAPAKKTAAKKKPGRPKGSKNKTTKSAAAKKGKKK